MIGKLHDFSESKIFACCDKELLGKTLSFGEAEINLSSGFFGTEVLEKEQIKDFLNQCDSANIFGERICAFLLSENLISKDQIIYIDKIPHIQIYKI